MSLLPLEPTYSVIYDVISYLFFFDSYNSDTETSLSYEVYLLSLPKNSEHIQKRIKYRLT